MTTGIQESLLIVGSGAMACLFAARVSAVGTPVVMLANWQEGIEVLKQHGVTLVESHGGRKIFSVKVVSDPGECLCFHLALVLVKSWQTRRAAEQLVACLLPDGIALSLQNGLGNREILNRVLGEERVALGTVTTGANLLAPGVVKMAGEGVVTLGVHPRVWGIEEILSRAGFVVEHSSDLESLLWGKLMINAAINPLTALFEIPNGELVENPYTYRIMKEVVAEIETLAAAQGIHFPYQDSMATVKNVIRKTAENRSSMLQDIQRGAPTEIDAICGAIVEAGQKVGVDTPINRMLWHLIHLLLKQLSSFYLCVN